MKYGLLTSAWSRRSGHAWFSAFRRLGPNDRVLVTVVAHTTSERGSDFEVAIPARFLKPGVFDVQNIISIRHAKLVRRLGVLTSDQMETVAVVVRKWIGF